MEAIAGRLLGWIGWLAVAGLFVLIAGAILVQLLDLISSVGGVFSDRRDQ